MALTRIDRDLLQRCLARESGAWNDFVDRFLGLIYHVVRHTSHLRSTPLSAEDTEDLASEVLLQLIAGDYAILRQFKGNASLATYLTVIARRICVHELVKRGVPEGSGNNNATALQQAANPANNQESGLEAVEEVERLLAKLPTRERQVVRLFYLERRSYEEISTQLNIPVNTIGPILSRVKKRLRQYPSVAPRPARTPPAENDED